MAIVSLASALKEFELALEDLASNLEFLRAARHVRPRLRDMLHWQQMDHEARELAGAFLRQRTAEESVLYRGMVVSLYGAFEHFVRRILRDSIAAINAAGGAYENLHENIKKHNIHRTGIALGTVFEPPDYLELDYEALARNIGTCFAGSQRAVLNADAFTIFVSIVSPDQLTEVLKRIGIKMNWDELGQMPALRKAFDKPDTRETAKAIQEFLRRFGRTRNKIAHSGSGGVVVTELDVEQFLGLFRALAGALCLVVEARLEDLVAK
jgi:RiboL-PSP-HEPN